MASATGTTATPGSATPRSCCGRCTGSASTGKRSSTSPSSSTRWGLGRHRRQRRRRVQPADHVRDRRRDRPHRAHPRPSLGIRRLASGAHRQRRVQPASARRVGDAPRRRRLEHPQRRPDGAADLGRHRRAGRHRDRDEPRTRPGHLGDAGQAAALRRVEGDVLGGGRAGHPPRRIAWRQRARREVAEGRRPDARRDLQEGRRRPRGSSPSTTAPTRSTRRCC